MIFSGFRGGGAGDITLTNEGGAMLIYTSSRWRLVGTAL